MCFGSFGRICHWGPLIALGIIKIVSWMTLHCLSMWWPPWTTLGSSINVAIFLTFAGCTIYFFLSALSMGPGFVPLEWKPEKEEDSENLQFCAVCLGYKAPRAHHCRKCGRCVKKMDHHCPWINGCVGWANHVDFTLFLFFAVLGCTQSTFILSASMYRGIHRNWYLYYGNGTEPIVQFTLVTLVMTVLALGLAIGVVLAVGMLFYFQFKSILRNRTAIEDWIEEKANHRLTDGGSKEKFLFPYELGWRQNLREVFQFSLRPVGNGIVWTVRDECNQYSLTIEQLHQKAEKRERCRVYVMQKSVRGGWCPLSAGLRTVFRPPCTDEARIPLQKGDYVAVTRWRKFWLFGEKMTKKNRSSKDRVRGWFPRSTAVELIGDLENLYESSEEEGEPKKEI